MEQEDGRSAKQSNPTEFKRRIVSYEDLTQDFRNRTMDFSKQFCHIYTTRLTEMKDILLPRVALKWEGAEIVTLADLDIYEDKESIIIGTLYKHQKLKPSILNEISDDHHDEPKRHDYCSEKDTLFLEDEMLRIRLAVDQEDLKNYVTGVVCAILGRRNAEGGFAIKDWCFPGCPPRPVPAQPQCKGKLLFLSGLDLVKCHDSLSLNLLMEWLSGMVGDEKAQEATASIIRVIIAGNSVKTETRTNTPVGHAEGKAQDIAIAQEIIKATKNVDVCLAEIAKCCCVTLMPGQYDPTNAMLPQSALHPCILPRTSRYESFKSESNPWIGKIDERIVMGSSGQPIEDIAKVTGATNVSPIDWLEKTLIWRHMCPTAPDTLSTYPYFAKDPFIIKHCPDIYFVGNTEKFETRLWRGNEGQVVRLISVPRFSTAHTVVTVDMDSLETECVYFGVK